MQTPQNLRPYGGPNSPNLPPVDPGSMQELVLQRARDKLEIARTVEAPAAGPDIGRTLRYALLALFLGLLPGLLGIAMLTGSRPEPGGAMIAFAFAALPWLIPVFVYVLSVPSSPARALKGYLKALGRGSYSRASVLVVDGDKDSFARVQPYIDRLGMPTPVPHRFDTATSFESYWKGLLRWRPPCYCLVKVSGVKVTPLRDDLALVECQVRFMMNSSLWSLMFLVIGIFAIIIDAVTRTTVTLPLRKVMVRTGNEWRVFNGELMGADEHDLRWLDNA